MTLRIELKKVLWLVCSLFPLAAVLLAWMLSSPWPVRGQGTPVKTLSAASYTEVVTPGSIVAAFGSRLATGTAAATSQPLPTTLAGTTVKVKGVDAPLFFVSPSQVNYLIPPGTPTGVVDVVVTSGDGTVSVGNASVEAVAPSIFTANSSGQGLPAAYALRVLANGTQRNELVARFDPATNQFISVPIDLRPVGDRVFLVLFLCGIRNAPNTDGNDSNGVAESIRVMLNGNEVRAAYAGPAQSLAGLDQINVELPRNLSGRVSVQVEFEDVTSNIVEVDVTAPEKAPTTVALSSSPNPSVFGQSVTFTAQVRVASGVPTGTVIFRDGATTLGSSNLNAGQATILRSTLATGVHQITAHYNGDSAFSGNWNLLSNNQIVNKAGVSIVVTSLNNTVARGQTATLEAAVTAKPPGAGIPTEILQFRDGNVNLGTTVPLVAGKATLSITTLTPGTHTITAEYYGDPNFLSSTFPPPGFSQNITNPPLQVLSLTYQAPIYAGDEITIKGSGFCDDPAAHDVKVIANDGGTPTTATVVAAEVNQLKALVPFGAGSGRVTVVLKESKTEETSPDQINLGTSISGYVQEAQVRNGKLMPQGIQGLTVRATSLSGHRVTDATKTDGLFILKFPAAARFGNRTDLYIEVPASLPFNPETRTITTVGLNRDNQYSGDLDQDGKLLANIIELKRKPSTTSIIASHTHANAPDLVGVQPCSYPITRDQVTFDINNSTITLPAGTSGCLSLTVLDPERTPSNLPISELNPDRSYFSSTIAQITPFGATLNPGGKLTFPNRDSVPAKTKVKVFRFEQDVNNSNLGRFISDSEAIVSDDGKQIVTAPNAVKQTSYYFVSPEWPTATIIGRVVETDGFPVRRAVVNARGQSVFTNDTGGFALRNVPVITPDGLNDQVTVEISIARPDQRVDRIQRSVAISAKAVITVNQPLVLPRQTLNRQPQILAPTSLVVTAGKTHELKFLASDPEGQAPNVMVSGVTFASPTNQNCISCSLRLAPSASDVGDHTLKIIARENTGPEGTRLESAQNIVVKVQPADNSALVANDLSATTDEDKQVTLTLTVSNPGNRTLSYKYKPPRNGSIGGDGPNIIYRPFDNFSGIDSFSFKVSNGARESNWATVVIAVNPLNDPPKLILSGAESLKKNAGEKVEINLSVDDVDVGQTYSFTADGLPPGAAFIPSAKTAQFIWTPAFTQKGSYEVSFMVSDDGYPTQPKDTKKVTITVDAKWAKTSGPDGGSILSLLNAGDVLYAGAAGSGVYRSTDKGKSWAVVRAGLLDGGLNVRAMEVSGTSLFAGTDNGIYRSIDKGQNWEPYNNGLPIKDGVPGKEFGVWAMAASGMSLYAGANNGVYLNNGQSWMLKNNGLSVKVWTLKTSGMNLYAGTDGGVYRSVNNGDNWTLIGSGPLKIRALEVSGTNLYAGTDGGGVYRLDGQIWIPVPGLSGPGSKVRALAVSGGILYAGTYGDGAYRFSVSGQSWVSVKDGLSRGGYKVQALAVIATTLYAGTEGEGVYRLSDNVQSWINSSAGIAASQISTLLRFGNNLYAGTLFRGVYRSADDGQSWEPVNAGLLDEGLNVRALAAVMGTKLYVGTEGDGVYVLSDDGKSWSRVGMGLTGNGLRVWTLAVSGTSLFAGAANPFPGPENPVDGRAGVYRLSDDGKIWERRSTELIGAGLNVWALAFNGNDLYAGTTGGGVWRSTNNGMNWVQVRDKIPANASVCAFTFSVAGLYVGTVFSGDGVYRSRDSGQTWEQLKEGLSAGGLHIWAQTFYGISVYAGTSDGVYRYSDAEQKWKPIGSRLPNTTVFTLTFNGAKLFAGTNGDGVSLLSDSAQSWAENTDGLSNKFVNSVAVSNSHIFAGTLGSGVFRSPIQDNLGWSRPDNSLPLNADIQSIVTDGSNVWAAADRDGIYHSSNQGGSWTKVPVPDNREVNELFLNSPMLYAGTNSGVLFSMNQGASWMDAGLPNRRVISFAASGGVLYAGTDGGGVFRYNGGTTWTPVTASLSVQALGVSGTTLYAGTIDEGIFISNDGGSTWTKAMNGLPQKLNVYAFEAIEKAGKKKVYAGTIYGVYVTEDAGQSWKLENAGLLNVFVTGLAVSGDRLFASTASGGVFVSQIP